MLLPTPLSSVIDHGGLSERRHLLSLGWVGGWGAINEDVERNKREGAGGVCGQREPWGFFLSPPMPKGFHFAYESVYVCCRRTLDRGAFVELPRQA